MSLGDFEPRHTHKQIAVFDTETDPFKEGREVRPFSCGYYDGEVYADFWGDDCIEQFFAWFEPYAENKNLLIYAHNGGKFDFHFISDWLEECSARIINGRIVAARYAGQEWRDSYAIIPIPLAAYDKGKIDYALFERGLREQHRAAIMLYQQRDCTSLHGLVTAFHDRFGDRLTIGGTAFKVLSAYHPIERLPEKFDALFREYYFGGRVQCFEIGDIRGPLKLFDVNSMYPKVMRDFQHPIGSAFVVRREINEHTDFAKIEAINMGALPARADDGSLSFDKRRGEFFATGHEIRAGLETGTLKLLRVIQAIQFFKRGSFADFINDRYEARLAAKAAGDAVNDIFEKLLMNSSYGRTAINPRKFKDYKVTSGAPPDDKWGFETPGNPWGWALDSKQKHTAIWARRLEPKPFQFCNVATAASITGAARATLLRGLSNAVRPVYCDTDSIVCEGLAEELDNKKLGAWKLEAEGERMAIAGKKLYCFFQNDGKTKIACKGGVVTPGELVRIANGETVEKTNDVPTFKRSGAQEPNTRKFRRTGKAQPFIKGSRG